MSDYDQRQYRLMLETLTAFEHGNIHVGTVIADLEGLLNALEKADAEWKQSFLRWWGQIEDARAYALFHSRTVLSEDETKNALDAVKQLRLMILDKTGI